MIYIILGISIVLIIVGLILNYIYGETTKAKIIKLKSNLVNNSSSEKDLKKELKKRKLI